MQTTRLYEWTFMLRRRSLAEAKSKCSCFAYLLAIIPLYRDHLHHPKGDIFAELWTFWLLFVVSCCKMLLKSFTKLKHRSPFVKPVIDACSVSPRCYFLSWCIIVVLQTAVTDSDSLITNWSKVKFLRLVRGSFVTSQLIFSLNFLLDFLVCMNNFILSVHQPIKRHHSSSASVLH